jgi:aspartyl-tRNA(Asn)/glutamyl-tRNA(Gln) amidotransferase subunit A
MIAFASSLDQAGPMARIAPRTARCCWRHGGFDPTATPPALDAPAEDFVATLACGEADLAGLRIGVAERVLSATAWRPTCAAAVRRGARPSCAALGATLRRRQPAAHRAVDPGVLHHRAGRGQLATSRASTACSSATAPPTTPTCVDMYKQARAEGFGAEVKRRIMIGTYVLSPRLLRRLLPAGAEDPPHDCRRLPACLRADCDVIAGPGGAHRGLDTRRNRPTTRWPPTWPTS